MDISKITYSRLKEIYIDKGYKFYTDPYDLNIIGIRSMNPIENKYNDIFAYCYKDYQGNNIIKLAPGTTLPGDYWLKNPSNNKGTAIVKEGYYPHLWQVGLHTGYKALVQINPITVYRDSNKDNEYNLISGTEDTGYFGINHHHSWVEGLSLDVNKWSAGCMVVQPIFDWFDKTLFCINIQIKAGLGDIFSFGLLNERDL